VRDTGAVWTPVTESMASEARGSSACLSTSVSLDRDIAQPRHPMVSRDQWVRVNARLIDKLGVEAWLIQLLDVSRASVSEGEDADVGKST
jgi:hypothetical protein